MDECGISGFGAEISQGLLSGALRSRNIDRSVGQVGKFLGVNELRSTWMEVSRTTSESFFLNLFYSVLEKNGEAEEEI